MKARPKNPARPDQTGAPSAQSAATPTAAAPDLTRSSPAPELDVKEYRKMLSDLDLESIEHRLNKAIKRSNDAAAAAAAEITQTGIIPQAFEKDMFDSLQELIEIAKWAKSMQELLTPELQRLLDLRETLESPNWKTFIECVRAGEEKINALEPFLEAELPAIRTHPGYESATLEDIESFLGLDGQTIAETIGGQPIPPFIRDAIERAIEATNKADLPEATARRAEIVEYPIDKINSTVWSLLEDTTGPQIKLLLKAEKDGSKKQLNILYSIDFTELEETGLKITKRLMPFDKRVYIAISALYNAGNKIISLTQIYYAMGNTGKPSTNQIQKIQDSITKMSGARVFVDNEDEVKVYKYTRFKYDGPLLPIERATAIVNGKIADAAIHIFREPPVMSFAKERKQFTTITIKALQSPISKTDANLLIDDYLIERITKAKNAGKSSEKILYKTLYASTQITTSKQKDRATDKIKIYLNHYKNCGLIREYSILKDGLQIDI